MNFLNKFRNQPKYIKKAILWTTTIILALILGFLWIYSSYRNIENLKNKNIIEELNFPKIEKLELNEQ